MTNSKSGFWANFSLIALIITMIIGFLTGNTIFIVAPVVIIVVVVLCIVFTLSTHKTIKPEQFLMTGETPSTEKSFLQAAKKMLDTNQDERVRLFLRGLISHYSDDCSDYERSIAGNCLNERQSDAFLRLLNAFKAMSQCEMIWYIASKNEDLTKSSATHSVERKKTSFTCGAFNHVSAINTNEVPIFRDLHNTYYLYPEYVVKAKSPIDFEVIPFEKVIIRYNPKRFVESEYEWNWPKDGQVITHTYQFVNKNGKPDMRYANNKRVPVFLYGELTIDIFGLTYQTSQNDVTKEFVKAFNDYRSCIFDNWLNENTIDNIFGIDSEYYKQILQPVKSIVALYRNIEKDDSIMMAVDGCLPPEYGEKWKKLLLLFLSDMMKNYRNMGYDCSDLKNREGFAMVLMICLLSTKKEYSNVLEFGELNLLNDMTASVQNIFNSVRNAFDNYPDDDFFFISKVLTHCRRNDLRTSYLNDIYRLFSMIAKADKVINAIETSWLEKLSQFSNQIKQSSNIGFDSTINADVDKDFFSPEENLIEPMEELNQLIGLSNVKEDIKNLSNLVKIQKMREERGMKTSSISYHCIFTGNPGTGKTTVARLVAAIYKQLGVLKKGHLVETDRSGLVAEYVGQTAAKTNAIIDSALDGVLFIDEAYSLIQGGKNDYGSEAISTLLKRMEDERNRLVVILAGYTNEMTEFINSNSGLQSRFNRYIEFPDYSCEELVKIFEFIANENDCVVSTEALTHVKKIIETEVLNKNKNFGNARFVRNLFENIITRQANRLAAEPSITNEMLSRIEAVDVVNVVCAKPT